MHPRPYTQVLYQPTISCHAVKQGILAWESMAFKASLMWGTRGTALFVTKRPKKKEGQTNCNNLGEGKNNLVTS